MYREFDPATDEHLIVEAAGTVLYYHAELDGKFCWPNLGLGKLHQGDYKEALCSTNGVTGAATALLGLRMQGKSRERECSTSAVGSITPHGRSSSLINLALLYGLRQDELWIPSK